MEKPDNDKMEEAEAGVEAFKEFLKALANFTTGMTEWQSIDDEWGLIRLLLLLKDKEIDFQVRDLVLQILAEKSTVFADEVTTREFSYYHKNLNVFLDDKIGAPQCEDLKNFKFRQNTESMKNMLTLVKNLSLADAGSHLLDAGAVNLLVKVLHDHGSSLSLVVELAVKVLLQFADDPDRRKVFLNGGIILVVRTITTMMAIFLASVTHDIKPVTYVSTAKLNEGVFQALNTILYDGETSRDESQNALLAILNDNSKPLGQVCAFIFDPSIPNHYVAKASILASLQRLPKDIGEQVGELAFLSLESLLLQNTGK